MTTRPYWLNLFLLLYWTWGNVWGYRTDVWWTSGKSSGWQGVGLRGEYGTDVVGTWSGDWIVITRTELQDTEVMSGDIVAGISLCNSGYWNGHLEQYRCTLKYKFGK